MGSASGLKPWKRGSARLGLTVLLQPILRSSAFMLALIMQALAVLRHSVWLLLVGLLCAVGGLSSCSSAGGGSAVHQDSAADDDDSAADDDDSAADDDDSAADDDDSAASLLTEQECARICLERDVAGGCPFEYLSGDCQVSCAHYATFSYAAEQAFANCVATDPLCFQDIHRCVLNGMYPEQESVPFVLTASGFEAWEGAAVVIALEAGGSTFEMAAPTTVSGGAFSAHWQLPSYIPGNHLALYYLDLDGNSDCDPDVDLPGSGFMELGPDIDNPSFSAFIVPPANDAAFVCDFI